MIKHYCVVREDLPLGIQAAMLVHAAGESGPAVTGTTAVVLGVPNETALRRLIIALNYSNASYTVIKEPDPPWNGQTMAIGIAPTDSRIPILNRYQLLRRSL